MEIQDTQDPSRLREQKLVLYVDDDPALLEICKLFLELSGQIHVDILSCAHTALEHLATSPYDAIISDYQMPSMDGISFLKRLRSQGNSTPFILFTGRGREEVVIEAYNNGADFYLQKGGDPEAQFTELEHKILLVIEQRKLKADLVESQQRVADIIDFLPDATFAINLEGSVISWNRAMEDLTGVSKESILGTGNYSYALPFYRERHPILIDLVFCPDLAIKEKYMHVQKAGNKFIADGKLPNLNGKNDTCLWGIVSPLFDGKGNVIGAIESIRDITEMKRTDEALYREKQFSDAVIDTLPGTFFVIDRRSQYVRCNKYLEELLGIPADQLRGRSVLCWVLEDDRPMVERAIAEVFSTGYAKTRARVMGARKSVRDFILTGRRMDLGEEVYLIGTGIDITGEFPCVKETGDTRKQLPVVPGLP